MPSPVSYSCFISFAKGLSESLLKPILNVTVTHSHRFLRRRNCAVSRALLLFGNDKFVYFLFRLKSALIPFREYLIGILGRGCLYGVDGYLIRLFYYLKIKAVAFRSRDEQLFLRRRQRSAAKAVKASYFFNSRISSFKIIYLRVHLLGA